MVGFAWQVLLSLETVVTNLKGFNFAGSSFQFLLEEPFHFLFIFFCVNYSQIRGI